MNGLNAMESFRNRIVLRIIECLFTCVCMLPGVGAIGENMQYREKGIFSVSAEKGEYTLIYNSKHNGFELRCKSEERIGFYGPIVAPGYLSRPADNTFFNDTKERSIGSSGIIKGTTMTYGRSATETPEGVVLEEKHGTVPAGKKLQYRIIFPVKHFAGRKIMWDKDSAVIPQTPDGKFSYFDDDKNQIRNFRIQIDEDTALELKFLSKLSSLSFYDCRKWKEQNFNLVLVPSGEEMKYLIRIVNIRSAFPAEEGKNKNAEVKQSVNLIEEGSSFETGPDGINIFNYNSWNEKMIGKGTWPVFDKNCKVEGNYSLKFSIEDPQDKVIKQIENGPFMFNGVIFKRVKLKRDTDYTLSAWMKSDTPGVKGHMFCGEKSWGGFDWGGIAVDDQWKRYTKKFHTPKNFKATELNLVWLGVNPSSVKKGHLWIDAVQLQEGEASSYTPYKDVEIGTEVRKQYKLFEKGSSPEIFISLRNNSAEQYQGTIRYKVTDFWNKTVAADRIDVALTPKDGKTLKVLVKSLPLGYYRAYFTLDKIETEEVIFGVYQPQDLSPLPEDWPLACHADPSEIVRRLGFGSVRVFTIFNLGSVTRDGKTYDFTLCDKVLEEAGKNGLSLLVNLDGFGWPTWQKEAPTPLELCTVTNHPVNPRSSTKVCWPKINVWENYIGTLVSRYKGKQIFWEVLNEPNLKMAASAYMPYLKSAYQSAKRVDRQSRIVGICATSDFETNPGSFMDHAINKYNAAEYLDILAVHLYGSNEPELRLHLGTDGFLEHWRKEMKKRSGKDVPIFDTEENYISTVQGYSENKINTPASFCTEKQFLLTGDRSLQNKAEYLIRQTILVSIYGHGKFYWFNGPYSNKFISHRIDRPYGLNNVEYDDSPKPELIAANALANIISNQSKPSGSLGWDGNNRGVLFSGKAGSVAALWNWKDGDTISVKIPDNNFKLYDFFGNSLDVKPGRDGIININLDSAPKYLSFPGKSSDALRKIMSSAKALNAHPEFRASLVLKKGMPYCKVEIYNNDVSTLSGRVSLEKEYSGWSFAGRKQPFQDIAAGKIGTVLFQLVHFPEKADIKEITFDIEANGKTYAVGCEIPPYASQQELLLSLAPADAAAAFSAETAAGPSAFLVSGDTLKSQGEFKSWKGVWDNSCSLSLRWDKDNFYIDALVYDDKIVQRCRPENAYEEDSLELFLDFSPETKKTGQFDSQCYQLIIAPASGKGRKASIMEIHRKTDLNAKVESAITANGYRLKCTIPWKSFHYTPERGNSIGFSFILNDMDDESGRHRDSAMAWTGAGPYPQSWGRLELK